MQKLNETARDPKQCGGGVVKRSYIIMYYHVNDDGDDNDDHNGDDCDNDYERGDKDEDRSQDGEAHFVRASTVNPGASILWCKPAQSKCIWAPHKKHLC